MIKNLRYVFASLLLMFGMSVNAGSIVFGDLGLENGIQYGDPFDGGDFTVHFSGGGNDGKYYNTGAGIRVYGGGSMTIEAKEGTLKKIVITFDGTYKPESADVVDGGTYDVATGTWTGDAASVVFTRPSGSGHWRVKSITTGNDAVGPDVPTEGQTAETAITVSRALEIINALDDGKSTDFAYYVSGYATAIDKITSTSANFFVGDKVDATNTVKTYNMKGLGNKAITNMEFVKAGDQVIIYGTLQKYVKNSEMTPEVSNGYVYSVNGKTEDDTPNPEDAIQGGTQDNPLTVEQAISYINDFANGFTTSKQYYVSGTVASVTEINTENGNATFVMGGLTVFRVKGLENKNITDANYLQENDEVIVCAKLQKYVKDDNVTPELSSGYIYSLNGKTKDDTPVDPVEFIGDGSETNPYLVSDLKQMTEDMYPTEEVWVKGVIVGSAKSGSALNTEDVASNIAIADDENATVFAPVALAAQTIFRTQLNVLDNPDNKGKVVLLCGKIQKYFSVTGLKDLTAAILNDEVISGITNVTIDATDATVYNLNGQRVEKAVRGLYIVNGKKVVIK